MQPYRMPKYSRSLNWSPQEKHQLLSLVERYREFIENKDCDSLSHKRRSEAWRTVAKQFALTFPPGREAQKMKEQYQRMKSSARKILAQYTTMLIQGNYHSDEDRQHLEKLPKWIDHIIRIAPRDFQEYCKVIRPSDFSDSDNFGGQDGDDSLDIDGIGESESESRNHSNQNSNRPFNEISDDCTMGIEEEGSPVQIKVEFDEQHNSPVFFNSEDRLGQVNPEENDTVSVASLSNADSNIPKPQRDSGLMKRLRNPTYTDSPTRRRKVAKQPQSDWTPESCAERIQWEEHLQRMQHLEEEHAIKMDIMNLHKQVLQQHVHFSAQDPSSAQHLLNSTAQMFDALSKFSVPKTNFTHLS